MTDDRFGVGRSRPGLRPGEVMVHCAGLIVGIGCSITFIVLLIVLIASDGGPHGYLLFFAGPLAAAVGLVAALVIPLAAPSGRRGAVLGVTTLAYVALLVAGALVLFAR